jgi:hypothetical protein
VRIGLNENRVVTGGAQAGPYSPRPGASQQSVKWKSVPVTVPQRDDINIRHFQDCDASAGNRRSRDASLAGRNSRGRDNIHDGNILAPSQRCNIGRPVHDTNRMRNLREQCPDHPGLAARPALQRKQLSSRPTQERQPRLN